MRSINPARNERNKKSCSKVIAWTKACGWRRLHCTNRYKNIKSPPVYQGDLMMTWKVVACIWGIHFSKISINAQFLFKNEWSCNKCTIFIVRYAPEIMLCTDGWTEKLNPVSYPYNFIGCDYKMCNLLPLEGMFVLTEVHTNNISQYHCQC